MSVWAALLGVPTRTVLITGIEDEPDPEEAGLFRVYVGPRYLYRYVLVDAATADDLRRQWGWGHLFTDLAETSVVYQAPIPRADL